MGQTRLLIVFDLDFTLWDAGGTWCDHTSPPYKKVNEHIVDREMREIVLYPEVQGILCSLKEKEMTMALASRTHSPKIALQFLEMFGISGYFAYRQIFPGSKVSHFQALKQESGIPYHEMFFFDDEMRNISEVGDLGVQTQLVRTGLNRNDLQIISFL